MATRSRSPELFLQRCPHLDEEEKVPPGPRLDVTTLLVDHMPLPAPPLPAVSVLRTLEGQPAPDRGRTGLWPGQGDANGSQSGS